MAAQRVHRPAGLGVPDDHRAGDDPGPDSRRTDCRRRRWRSISRRGCRRPPRPSPVAVAAEGEQLGVIQALEEMPFPAAAGRLAAVEDGLGLGDVGGLVLEAGAVDQAEVQTGVRRGRRRRAPSSPRPRARSARHAGLLAGGVGLDHLLLLGLALGDGLAPLPGDQAEADPEDQHQRRQQARRHRVAAAPAGELLRLADATGPDRPVLEERASGPRPARRPSGSGGPGRARSPCGSPSPGRAGPRDRAPAAAAGSPAVTRRISRARSVSSKAGRQRQQLVEGQAQRVDVAAGVALPLERLGRHVAQRAQEVAGAGQVLLVGRPWPGRSR